MNERLARRYNLPLCTEQYSAGNERPCCQAKWQIALNDPHGSGKALTNHPPGLPPTACIPGSMYGLCYQGQEEAQKKEPNANT